MSELSAKPIETLTLIQSEKGAYAVRFLDQTRLPGVEAYVTCANTEACIDAIRTMVVRGAPAIGVAAMFAMVLAAQENQHLSWLDFERAMADMGQAVKAARPTAVNLFWGVDAMMAALEAVREQNPEQALAHLAAVARQAHADDIAINQTMGRHGAGLLNPGTNILTHCNTGSLATAGYGTALGVIRAAWQAHGDLHVWVDETRPRLQGARLTAWELQRDGIPATLISDTMAGSLMAQGKVDAVIVGADRIAANGDTANKIGTYSVAVLAQAHGIPFYVAAPTSTIDATLPDGSGIEIEGRDPREVTEVDGQRIAPEGFAVYNPAFDVTPARFIMAIITEFGVLRPPYQLVKQQLPPVRQPVPALA